MLLERGEPTAASQPDAAAMLHKVGGVIKSVYSKVSVAKDVSDHGDWLLRAYGLGSLVYQTGKPLISGFLGSPG